MGSHLLIDGYNVLHSWKEGVVRLKKRESAAAREFLIQTVQSIHDTDGWRVTVVFDGQGEQPEIERPGNQLTFSILYSPKGVSADSIIEQIVANSEDPGEVTAVTQDYLIRETVQTLGGRTLHPDELRTWVDRCRERQRDRLKELSDKTGLRKWNQLRNWLEP